MRFVAALLAVQLMACGTSREAPRLEPSPAIEANGTDEVADPSEREVTSPAAPEPAEVVDTSAFHGAWVQTDDPTGAIQSDPVYAGSRVEVGADGRYSFGLGGGGSMGPLTGTWARTGGDGDVLRYVVTFSAGRVTDEETMRLRRADGEVVGLEIGDDVSGRRYYTRGARD